MIIREAKTNDSNGIARVIVDTWRSTYSGIMSQEFLDNMSYKKAKGIFDEAIKRRDRILLVVENSLGEIVGIAEGGKEREGYKNYQGEIYAIYILKEYQKKGLGKKIIHRMIKEFIHEDISSMIIWVLEDNSSRKFYEKLGGISKEVKYSKIGQKRLKEIGYIWNELKDEL
jgi:ribosomal protein S18 acetylase RimI-like enzyme